MLRAMLAAQVVLAGLVVLADLPADALRHLPGAAPRPPDTDVPVTPGDQTRRFSPRELPVDQPAGPGFLRPDTVPPRLTFTTMDIAGHPGALAISGMIEDGDARRFADHMSGLAEPPSAIALHSPGGAVDAALEIGRAIRKAGLPVVIAPGASCFSACPYMLAGGEPREVSRQARVGVHQHSFGENSYLPAFLAVWDVQEGQGEVMAYLDDMGIDPMLMAKALITPPDDIYILLPEELTEYRLATELAD